MVVVAAVVVAAVAVVVVEEDRIKTKYINDIVWKKISGLEFDNQNAELTFSKRLARENRWPQWYALDVIEEYRKFLYLLQRAKHPVTPSIEVDQVWHLHLTYSEFYWEDFAKGMPVKPHHGPTRGGSDEDKKFIDWYAKTLESYEQIFGNKPPVHIWPSKDERFRANQSWAWIDVSKHFIIDRNAGYVYILFIIFLMILVATIF